MNCRTFQRRLHSILDERLLPQDDCELMQHAWDCERCQRLLAGQHQLFNLLSSEPPPAPSSNMARRIVAHINQPVPSLSTSPRGSAAWMWLAVAASLLIIVAPIAMHFLRQPQPAPNSFVEQSVPPSNNDSIGTPGLGAVATTPNQQDFDKMMLVINRLREQQIDQSVDELTSPLRPTLRPITASFGITINALRKTLPLPNKNTSEQKPQADARSLDIYA